MSVDGRGRYGGDGVAAVFIWMHLNVACGGKRRGHLCGGSPQMATNLPGFALLYNNVIRSHTTSSDGPKPTSLSSSLTPAHLAFTCRSGHSKGSEGLANKLNQLFELTQAWSTWPGSCLWTW